MADVTLNRDAFADNDIRLQVVEDGVGHLANGNNYRWKKWGSVRSVGQVSPPDRSTASYIFMAIFSDGAIKVWYDINVHYPRQFTRFDFSFYDRNFRQLGTVSSMGVQYFEDSRSYAGMETSGPWNSNGASYFDLYDASVQLISDDRDH